VGFFPASLFANISFKFVANDGGAENMTLPHKQHMVAVRDVDTGLVNSMAWGLSSISIWRSPLLLSSPRSTTRRSLSRLSLPH